MTDLFKDLAARADSWVNLLTGSGTTLDKTVSSRFDRNLLLTDQELADLYHGDHMADKIVTLLPSEALRMDLELDPATSDLFKSLKARERILDAEIWGRCFGGAILFVGAEDGGKASQPLDSSKVQGVLYLDLYDKRRVSIDRRFRDPASKNYGQPEAYRLNNIITGASFVVHHSRVIVFPGAHTGEQEKAERDGWDHSVLQKCYEPLRQYNAAVRSGEQLLSDASQGVFKMTGLIARIASQGFEGLQARMRALDMSRSIARAIMLDKDEEFTRISTSFTGVPDMMDRFGLNLASAAKTPLILLTGQSPGGLQATGNSDVRIWYDSVASYQKNSLGPRISQLAKMCNVPSKVGFLPLWQESPKEEADRTKVEADRDTIYVDLGVILPGNLASSAHIRKVYPGIDLSIHEPAPLPAEPAPGEEAVSDDISSTTDIPDEGTRALADKMTLHKIGHCEHGRSNRCPLCGIERLRDVELGPDGVPVWSVAWKPLA